MTSNVDPAPRLRVGVLLDSLVQPRWIGKILDEIGRSPFAELCLVVRNAGPASAPTASAGHRLRSYWRNRDHLLYALYCKLDDAVGHSAIDAFEPTDLASMLADVPLLDVTPRRRKYSDWFADSEIERILQHRLDVALRFGFRILRGRALQIARHGVWSHHHGDNLVNRGGPAGFWEVMQGEPVSGAVLQILTEDLDAGKTICRGWSPTIDRFSVRRNKNNFYWKATTFVPKKLRELHEDGVQSLAADPYCPSLHAYSRPLYKAPRNREMLPLLGGLCRDYVHRKLEHRLYFDQWTLAYRFRGDCHDSNRAFHKFIHLVPPKDRFWADPFPLQIGNRYYIVFEEYLYENGRAHISAFEVDRKGNVSEPVVVLEQDYHLSYPFLFEWRGEHYMVPETAKNGRVEIYRSRSGNVFEWTFEGVLLDNIHAADATLHEIDGRWWMFVSSTMKGLHNWDELHLYHADNPMGPWKPHRRNPVKIDVKSARPAGRLFHSDALYRPAQDCSLRYGYATAINRIDRLSPSEFHEDTVSKILPNWRRDLRATHTLNSAGDLTVIDCQIKRSRFARA